MRAEMTTQISGWRDGQEWPRPGEAIDVPAHEAADLILAGYAKEATDAPTPGPCPRSRGGGRQRRARFTEDGDDAADAEPVARQAHPPQVHPQGLD